MRALVLIITLCAVFSLFAQAKIYKVVNEDGTISFSDTPVQGAQELELSGSFTTIESAPVNQAPPVGGSQDPDQVNYTLRIVSPEPEATIRDNNGKVSISSRLQPQTPGRYELNFAGTQYTTLSGVFNLEGVNRGAHSYSVKFIDNSGKVIASSEERTLYVHQASVLNRRVLN